jgi:hypothetical protein
MGLSSRFNRRGVLALAAALGLQRRAPVRAQTTCTVQFVNGILQYSPGCTSIASAGMNGMGITPPSHLAAPDPNAISTTTSTPQQLRQERLLIRRDRRDSRLDRKRDRLQEERTRTATRRSEALALEITCEDFTNQKAAIDRMAQFRDSEGKLDLDHDGLPCEHLTAVTCSQFSNQREADVWFYARGFHDGYDAFHLLEGVKGDIVCGDHFD